MNDTQQEITRSNDLGDPCPPWCTARHSHLVNVLGKMTPVRQHAGERKVHYAPDCSRSVELRLLQHSPAFAPGPARLPRLRAGAYTADGHGKEIHAATADEALALALLVEAAGAMNAAGRAELAAALRAAAAALPAEEEL